MLDVQLKLLKNYLTQFQEIPDEEWDRLVKLTKPMKFNKGESFVSVSKPPRDVAFVVRGLLRSYYETPTGRLIIKEFHPENSLCAPFPALLAGKQTGLCIDALENSEVLCFEYARFSELFGKHLCWDALGRKISFQHCIRHEERERELLICSAKERYESFLSEFAHLEKRIAQHHIAAYLGITAVSLSRIKSS